MGVLPGIVEQALEAALVSELTVLDDRGRCVSYPLIPLYDGERIYMTSSVLFSRKLDHIKKEPRVAVSITDPIAAPGFEPFHAVTIQGDARVVEDDLHQGWMRVLPLWRKKEPVIDKFVRQRFAAPLFFERSVIEVVPRRAIVWLDGAQVYDVRPGHEAA
jgi:general stress protein 26